MLMMMMMNWMSNVARAGVINGVNAPAKSKYGIDQLIKQKT